MQIGGLDILYAGYETIHDRIIPFMLKEDEDRLRNRLNPEINPIIWMIWHMLRVEDMFLSVVVFNKEQEFYKGSWQSRLHIDTTHVGTGMKIEEVNNLASQINIESLHSYNRAVKEHTLELIGLVPEWPTDVLDSAEEIERRLKAKGAFPNPVCEERAKAYAPTPISNCLLGVINHSYMHFGQYLSLTKRL